jgi:flagellar motility protein MotE (MotC chaperone)
MVRTAGKSSVSSRRRARGVLVVIAALFLASALLRLGDGAGEALARTASGSEGSPDGAALDRSCEPPEDLDAVLAAFQDREAGIAAKEEALAERMRLLEAAEQRVSDQLAALSRAEEELRSTMALADNAAEDDLARLTKVYENMKPDRAAALFEEMAPDFAAGFLGRMRPEPAAEIMAELSPRAAHTFSVVLAGRNAEVPTQ